MLIVAFREGHAQTVRILLENGVYIDGHLTIAARYGHIPVVKLLLEEGAEVNLKGDLGLFRPYGTPLRAAAWKGHKEITQHLLEAGADINDDEPVLEAVFWGHKEVMKLLLEKGANINARGEYGKTAFEIASSRGHKEIAELLQVNGAHVYTYGYCTQGCLLGLVRGNDLDENCPNVSLHRQGEDGVGHAIDVQTFARLIQAQLQENLDQDCEPLGIQGARGALFKVTLAAYGYTVVGKGTVKAFMPDLLHEGKIYQRLARLQGTAVPVYLGNIDLTEWYYLDVGVRIRHMLLMSWGGNLADEDESVKGWQGLQREIRRTVAEVRKAGVDQIDERPPNILWNGERKRVMLIDFERAKYIGGVLQETSPNKESQQRASRYKARFV